MKQTIFGILAVVLVPVGCVIAWPGEFGRHSAGIWLVICGLSCAVDWMKGRRQ